jgi:transposase-like protein
MPRSCWSNSISASARSPANGMAMKHTSRSVVSGGICTRRNLTAAKRFLRKAFKHHGRRECIVIDGSQTDREAILSCYMTNRLQDRSRRKFWPIRIRQSRYLNNSIEQDHRAASGGWAR